MNTIGILGGTFDPIHHGHLLLAQEVGKALHFCKVLFIPSKIPPHKKQTTSEENRYEMVKLATQDNPFFEVSRIELDRPQVSYTIETIRLLKQENREKLVFIIGADNILELPKWYRFDLLIQLCDFAIGSRPGFSISTLEQLIPFVGEEYCERMKQNCVEIPNLSLSSSEIRQRYAKGYTTRYLLPNCVHEYIQRKKLYSSETL